jgi:PKD repeat protein
MLLGIAISPLAQSEKPPDEPNTAWVITTTKTFSDMDGLGTPYAAGDSLTVNAGGTVTADISIGGSGSLNIIVNAGGLFIINPGISLLMTNANYIQVAEGGIIRGVGTSGSHITITFGSTATATNYFRTSNGGYIYLDYVDISGIYYFGVYLNGLVEVHNSTITGRLPLYTVNYGGEYVVTNSTITSNVVGSYCISGGVHLTARDVTFVSVTAARLTIGAYALRLVFAGCTYNGAAIASADIPGTAADYDIRIYEASLITETDGLPNVGISLSHPSMNENGRMYDRTNYLKIPGFLLYSPTDATGNTTLYLLNRSSYWRSGLAVISRIWQNWSNYGGVEATNAEWNITAARYGYHTDINSTWAGTGASVTLIAIETPDAEVNSTVRTYSTNVTVSANLSSKFNYTETVYINGTVRLNRDLTANVNVSVYNASDGYITNLMDTNHALPGNETVNLTDINSDTVLFWTPSREGQCFIHLAVTGANVTDQNVTEDFLISNLTNTASWLNTTTAGFKELNFGVFFEYRVIEPSMVHFYDKSVSEGCTIDYYAWDFGDGQGSEEANPTHAYSVPGTYTVTLTARNSNAVTVSYSSVIDVGIPKINMAIFLIVMAGVFCGLIAITIFRPGPKRVKTFMTGLIFVIIIVVVLLLQWTVE